MKYLKMMLVMILFPVLLCSCTESRISNDEKNLSNPVEMTEENKQEVEQEKQENSKELNTPYLFQNKIIHAVTIKDTPMFSGVLSVDSFIENEEQDNHVLAELKRGTNVSILSFSGEYDEIEFEGLYGFVKNEDVQYFLFVEYMNLSYCMN